MSIVFLRCLTGSPYWDLRLCSSSPISKYQKRVMSDATRLSPNLACDHSFSRGWDKVHLLSDNLNQVLGIITTSPAKMVSAVVFESLHTVNTQYDHDRPSRSPSQSPFLRATVGSAHGLTRHTAQRLSAPGGPRIGGARRTSARRRQSFRHHATANRQTDSTPMRWVQPSWSSASEGRSGES